MNLSSSHLLRFRGGDVVAMMLIALGAVVAGGWLLGRPMTVEVGSERMGMTIVAAISFILAGLALSAARPRHRLVLAGLLAILSVLTLCEHAFETDLYIDRLFGTSWVLQSTPHQGRMAPQVALAFALGAGVLVQLTRRRNSPLRWLAPLAVGAIFLIALISLFGRLLRLDIIYDWHYAIRIAPHTAIGLLLLSLGLAQLTYRRSFDKSDDVSNDSRRILAVSTASMLSITIACAATCFGVAVRHSHDLQQAALARELRNQVDLISAELASQRHEGERVASGQSLADILSRPWPTTGTSSPSPALRDALEQWADYRVPLARGLSALSLVDSRGQQLLLSGSFDSPAAGVVRLDSNTRIELGTEASLVIEHPTLPTASGSSSSMKMQFALPRLTAALQSNTADFDTVICHAPAGHSVQCLQLVGAPQGHSLVAGDGHTDALNLAFRGNTGVTLGAEPEGARFFAAYGPIAATPLVMTLSTPLNTLYSDLRKRLNVLLLLMIGLVAGAAWLLRWQIAPLLAKVVAARSRANDSAMHLTAIMDNAGDGIITVNRVGTVLSANPAFRRMIGSSSRDLIGEDLSGLLPGLEMLPDDHGLLSLAHCAGAPPMEFQRDAEDGQSLHLQVEFAWLDQATRSTLVATVLDLTLVKHGELELRETHDRLQHSERMYRDQATRLATLFDSVEDAIVVINASGNIESWNRGAQHLFGYAAEDIIGKDARLLMPEPHAAQLVRFLQSGERKLASGRLEMEARHGSGRIVPIEVSVRDMMIDGKRLYVAVMHDISVRREVDRMKSEFISTISHELRTPLTSIAGSLTLIASGAAGEVPPKATRLVGIARQNSERLIRLINDILDLEKAQAGKLDFQMSLRSLRAEIASVAEFNRGFAQSLGVAIELEDGDDADVLIDSDRLMQVLTNLISNAAKFSPPGGVVRIRVDREGADARITVSDNGPGIPADFCARIFQKFAQADASDTRVKGGTGLGLSIAKTITERLGGRIGFDTVPGKGTSFYVILPIHGQSADTHSADWQGKADDNLVEVERHATPRGESLPQILHVEDDQSLSAIVREAMSRSAEVTSARSVAAARQQLAVKHFDAVVLDVALPDGSGLDLLPIEVDHGKRAPVIVSYTADEPSRGLRASVDVALVKSRHSVTQLLVTVLANIQSVDDDTAKLKISSHP